MNEQSLPKKRPPGPGRGHKIKQGDGTGERRPPGGHGWGGPAKGAGKDLRDPENHVANPHAVHVTRLPDAQAAAERALAVMAEIMESSPYEQTRLNAAVALRNQVIGTPVARTILGGDPNNPLQIETTRVIDATLLTVEQRETLREVLAITDGSADTDET
jgi:hypothetical protein